jgi:uncharacterized damage-inducible protein DinB
METTISLEIISLLQQELENETATTRKMLAIVPAEKFDWQPHPKSMTLKRLSTHVAELPGWVDMAINTDELDFQNNPYIPADVKSTGELLDFFDACVKKGRKALEQVKEEDLTKEWVLRNGDQVYSRETKYEVIRMAHSQIIHHRAQLGVFLRLLNVSIPGSYGPSADDMTF